MVVLFVRSSQVFYPCGGLFGGDARGQFHIKATVMIPPVGVVATVAIVGVVPGKHCLNIAEGGVFWQIGIYAAHPEFGGVVGFYGFAHRVAVTEQGRGQGPGDDDRGRVLYSTLIALEHPEAEHTGEVGLGRATDPADGLVAVAEEDAAIKGREGNVGEEILV